MRQVHAETEETRLGAVMDLRIMGRFLAYVLPYRKLLIVAFLLLPVGTLFHLAQPLITKTAVDDYLAPGITDGFGWLVLGFGALIALQFVMSYIQSVVNATLGQRVVRDLRQKVFDHMTTLDAGFFHKNASGRITNRLTNDIEAVSQMVTAGFLNLVGDAILLIGIAVAMILLSPSLSLMALVALPILIGGTALATRRLRTLQRDGRVLISRMAGQLTEEVEGFEVVRLFRRQEKCQEEFDAKNKTYLDAMLKGNFWEAFQFSFVETASTIIIAGFFWYGAQLTGAEAVSIGTLVAFIEYVRRIFFPIRDISNKIATMQAAMTALERIFSLLDTPPEVTTPERPQFIERRNKGIRFEGVSFDYGKEPVLKGIDLTLAPGEKVAVVGPTGAGKSTLIKLLNRFYDVKAGRIVINGTDVRQADLTQLRRLVGVVQQESFLFSGTIAQNISLGAPEIDRERVIWAAQQVGADGFIEAMDGGYDADVAERGVNLSAGQKQLLGFARVLAFDPAVLVLDEATSSVDTVSERLIQDALKVLLKDRTSLIIAHRLSTIADADRIAALSHGRIVEEGTHKELLNKDGLYARLYKLQFKEEGALG